MSSTVPEATSSLHQGKVLVREVNCLIIAIILGLSAYIPLQLAIPQMSSEGLAPFFRKFVGISWPFFLTVMICLFYVIAAWLVEVFAFGSLRNWDRISQLLSWATEACPLVGLLTTFLSLLMALMAFGEAGPGDPETHSIFIRQFAIAFGSSIAGGMLALFAFTLHRIIPEPGNGRA